MRTLQTPRQVFKWMMKKFEKEGEPRQVPEGLADIADDIRRTIREFGFLYHGSINGVQALNDCFFREANWVELPGELAILAFTLSLTLAGSEEKQLDLAELLLLMSETHNELGGIVLRKGDRIVAVLPAHDARAFGVKFDVVLRHGATC